MRARGKILVVVTICAAFLGYQLLIHKAATSGQLTSTTAALVLTPFIVTACWAIAAEWGLSLAILTTTGLTLTALAAVHMFGLPHPTFIFGLPHLLTNTFLMWLFARTLANGRVPLITAIARRENGTLTQELEIYTRRLTLVWSLFFFLQIVTSLGLYIFATLEAWSTFINILNAPLVILMFLVEYIYRVMRFRDHHSSPLAGILAFFRDTPNPKSTKAR